MVITIFGAAITLVAVLVAAWFLGGYMVRVFTGERVFMTPVVRPVERVFYRLMDVREDQEQNWIFYLVAMMLVQVISFLLTYFVLRFQNYLPLNPQNFPGVPPALAFNTAVSFTTNTNWQNYTGESTMSYFSQMFGLVTHNFLSAATGIALAVALIRAVSSRQASTLGNFYVDVTRAILYILIPIAIIGGLFSGVAGRGPDPGELSGRTHSRRSQAAHRGGAVRLAGGDQRAWQQRRRAVQRQLRSSLRESQRPDQPVRAVPRAADPLRAGV